MRTALILRTWLMCALVATVAHEASALRLTNETTGEVLFFEDGFENDTFAFNPDSPEVGQWDSFDVAGDFTTNATAHPNPGPRFGDQYFIKGTATGENRTARASWPQAQIPTVGDLLHLEMFFYLPGGGQTNNFAWRFQLLNSVGNNVVDITEINSLFRPNNPSTTGILLGNAMSGGGVDLNGDGIAECCRAGSSEPTDGIPNIFVTDQWQKLDVYYTVHQGTESQIGGLTVTLTNGMGVHGPFGMSTGTNVAGNITHLVLIDDDRPDIWFLDYPEPGSFSVLVFGGLCLLKRARHGAAGDRSTR